jgi:antitoxin component of MazEF toxin-antitoxin module
MTITVKGKNPIVIPPAVSRQAAIKNGDELEFRVSRGTITIRPKALATDGEYTAAERLVTDRGIAKGLEDIRKVRVHGPFETADTAITHLKSLVRSGKKAAARKSSR